MRIIAGRFKGRSLRSPASGNIRPTSDRLRESLFNVLMHAYSDPVDGARILDLFAGTGALGLEALSRGAKFACFVEDAAEARGLIKENIETLALRGKAKFFGGMQRGWAASIPMSHFRLSFATRLMAKISLQKHFQVHSQVVGLRIMPCLLSRSGQMYQ